MDEAESPLVPGTRLGKFKILRLLAVGGMAEIYLARASGIEGFAKAVVLKRILPRFASEPQFVEMFLDEARLTATFSHPNVVQVYDIGRIGKSPFFTMEYVHGEDLRSVLAAAAKNKRGLKLSHAISVVTQVAAGLHYAHDKKGLDGQPLSTVHRDVSPSNVMITFDGGVKIVDFGIAKAAASEAKTESGATKGTLQYMSPEQYRGDEVDRRSDVFAIGILLFELTTGTRLFRERNRYAFGQQLVEQDAPLPSERRPGYPGKLEAIVKRALQREPSARFATAQELQRELEDFARNEKLSLSAVELEHLMRELFGSRADSGPMDQATVRNLDTTESEPPLADSAPDEAAEVFESDGAAPATKPRRWLPIAGVGAAGVAVIAAVTTTRVASAPPTEAADPPEPGPAPARIETATTEASTRARVPTAPPSAAPEEVPAPDAAPTPPYRAPRPAVRPPSRPAASSRPPATVAPSATPWDLDSPLPPPE